MRRTLIITRNLPPLLGGMERLNWHLAEQLAEGGEVRVIGPSGAAKLAPAKVLVREVRLYPLIVFLLLACWRGMRESLKWRPHVVLAGSGLTAPLAWIVGRWYGAQVIVYVHGLDIIVPSVIYRLLWIPFIRRADRIIANSHATATLAVQAGIGAKRIGVVNPGVEMPRELQRDAAALRFRRKHDLQTSSLLLSVGRLTRRKGIKEFVTEVLPLVIQVRPDVLFLVAGDGAAQALYGAEQTRESIQSAAEGAGVASNIRFLGRLTEEDLRDAYCTASVHVFPIRDLPGDIEGFGMVAVEAAAYGLPTIAYSIGGVVDAVSDGVSGHLVCPGNVAGFAEAILRCISAPMDQSAMRLFASRFEWARFGGMVREELEKLTAEAGNV
jgi:phosphatidylinositol alpha-1,6-mannosyltransferase